MIFHSRKYTSLLFCSLIFLSFWKFLSFSLFLPSILIVSFPSKRRRWVIQSRPQQRTRRKWEREVSEIRSCLSYPSTDSSEIVSNLFVFCESNERARTSFDVSIFLSLSICMRSAIRFQVRPFLHKSITCESFVKRRTQFESSHKQETQNTQTHGRFWFRPKCCLWQNPRKSLWESDHRWAYQTRADQVRERPKDGFSKKALWKITDECRNNLGENIFKMINYWEVCDEQIGIWSI